jgi:hypothetical protein
MSPTFCVLRDLLYPLLPQPVREFRDRNHDWVVLLRDFHRIADVVEMAVSAKHDVHMLNAFLFIRTHRITHDPGVYDQDFSIRSFNTEGGVTQPCELDSTEFHVATFLVVCQMPIANWFSLI